MGYIFVRLLDFYCIYAAVTLSVGLCVCVCVCARAFVSRLYN